MTAAAAIALSSVLLFVARDRGRAHDPLLLWAIAMGLGAIGLVLYAAPLPLFLTQDVSKALMLLASAVSWNAARVFTGRRVLPTMALGGPVLWMLACQIPAFSISGEARLGLSCTIGAIYTLLTTIAFWPPGHERLHSRFPALVLLSFHTGLYFARAGLAFSGLDSGWDGPLTSVMMLEAQLHTVGMAFILIAMTKERAEQNTVRHLEAARQAGDARGRFLAQMSHEVRPPLRGMLGLTQLLARDPTLRADQRHHIETLEAGGQYLLAIVNDALDITHVDTGRFNVLLQPFSPIAVIEACLALVRSAAIERRIVLRLYAEPNRTGTIEGDSRRLRQVMLNLLWNAIKWTPEAGAISVSVTGPGQFDVRDTGPRISPELRDQVFESPGHGESGGGIGLAISLRVAEQLGGTLTHHPGPDGVGNLFRLSLPWSQQIMAEPLPNQIAPEPHG